jgi:cell division protein FtsB
VEGVVMGKKKKRPAKRGKASRKKTARRKADESRRDRRLVDFAIVAMLLLAAYFAVFGGEYSIFDVRRLQKIEAASSAEVAVRQAAIDSLQALANHIESDPVEIERVARENYGMIRDGEILYRFREVKADSVAADSAISQGGD